MNQRERGDEVEDFVLDQLNRAGLDFKKTTNSGAKNDDGDLTNRDFIIEVKLKPTSGVSTTQSELAHVRRQAEQDLREWAVVVRNRFLKHYAIIELQLFIDLLKRFKEYNEQIVDRT